ncbi:MAG: adenylate/guanylate cyclase domain-containing protein [Candidatus Eiseniibacteriota bacterium]
MGFLPSIRFGTERYPEKVARRLRALNIATWSGAAVSTFFAIVRFLDPTPDMWVRGFVNVAAAAIFAAIPLLHRLGPLAAPIVFIVATYAFIFSICQQVGTGGGAYLYYLTGAALALLFLGIERIWLAAAFTVLAATLIIVVHVVMPVNAGLMSAEKLFLGNFVTNVIANAAVLFAIVYYAVRQIARAEAAAEAEHERSETLLANILPPRVAARLKQQPGQVIADAYPEASILIADMAGFTARARDSTPDELVRFLNAVFTRFDGLVERHGLEKIKTTGDSYMVVGGVPDPRTDHAEALAHLALDMRDALSSLADARERVVPLRIGIATGPVVAGVVGTRKFFYDVWGDAVNTAARMESTGEPGRIQVAPETYERLKDRFALEERGLIEVRGKGPMRTWFLVGRLGNHSRAERIDPDERRARRPS